MQFYLNGFYAGDPTLVPVEAPSAVRRTRPPPDTGASMSATSMPSGNSSPTWSNSRSELSVTLTSPRKPCARPMRPPSSRDEPDTGSLFDDVDGDLDAFGGTRSARHLAQRLHDLGAR